MPTVIEMLSDRLRDRDPAVRLNSARQLAESVDRFGSACLPALLASLDTAVAEAPARKAASLHHALNHAWRTAAHETPDAAALWYGAMVDMLCGYDLGDPGDSASFERLVATLLNDPKRASYAPLLRPHLTRILNLLGALAIATDGQPDVDDRAPEQGRHADALVRVAVNHAGRDEESLASIIDVLPQLVSRDTNLDHFISLATFRHPRPPVVLARLIDTAVVRGNVSDHSAFTFGELLLREDLITFSDLCECLRPRATHWSDAQLDSFVRDSLLDFEDGGLDLIGTLRRAPTRRLIPQMLVDLGRTTPAMTDLASVLADSHRVPARTTAPTESGIPFQHLNFKLAVINELMYEQDVLSPAFDVWTFAESWPEREILSPDGEAGPIPEVLRFFAELPLTTEQLQHVTTLSVERSSRIYHELDPWWGGEEDWFDIHSFEDVVHLPKLRTLHVDGMVHEDVDFGPLHRRGVDIDIDVDC
ncbi:hypothetical protein [Streptomyces sp. NPDC005989]|uniref:DUF6892 domain-containing protein n=1 Tax=Streptomyces sp. NPDC005989 TaxID=3156727 RepID=UPI003402B56D